MKCYTLNTAIFLKILSVCIACKFIPRNNKLTVKYVYALCVFFFISAFWYKNYIYFFFQHMGKDARGVARGTCKNAECDCDDFELNENDRGKCGYCNCPAPQHENLDQSKLFFAFLPLRIIINKLINFVHPVNWYCQ